MQKKSQRQAMAAIRLAHEASSKIDLSQYEATMLEPLDIKTGLPQRTISTNVQLTQMSALKENIQQLHDVYQLCKENITRVSSAGSEALLQISHQIEHAQALISAVSSQQDYLDNQDQVQYMQEAISTMTTKLNRIPVDEARVLSLCQAQDVLLAAKLMACRQALDSFNAAERSQLVDITLVKNTEIIVQEITQICDQAVDHAVNEVRNFIDITSIQAQISSLESEALSNAKDEPRLQNKAENSPAVKRYAKKELGEDATYQEALEQRQVHITARDSEDGIRAKVDTARHHLLEVVKSGAPSSHQTCAEQYRQNLAVSQQLQTQLDRLPYQLVSRAHASSSYNACDIAISTAKMNNSSDIRRGEYKDNPALESALARHDFSAALQIVDADPNNNDYAALRTNLHNVLEAQQDVGPRQQLYSKVAKKIDNGAGVYVKDNTVAQASMVGSTKMKSYRYYSLRRADVKRFQSLASGSKSSVVSAADSLGVLQEDPKLREQVNAENTSARQFILGEHGSEARASAVKSLEEEAQVAGQELQGAKKQLLIAQLVSAVHKGRPMADRQIDTLVDQLRDQGVPCTFQDVQSVGKLFDAPPPPEPGNDSGSSSPKGLLDRFRSGSRQRSSSDADIDRSRAQGTMVKRSHSSDELMHADGDVPVEQHDVVAKLQEQVANLELNAKQKELISLGARQDLRANRRNSHLSEERCVQSFVKQHVNQTFPDVQVVNSQDVVTNVVCQQAIVETVSQMQSLFENGQCNVAQTAQFVDAQQKRSKADSTTALLGQMGGRGEVGELTDGFEDRQDITAERSPTPSEMPSTPVQSPQLDSDDSSYEGNSGTKLNM